MATPQDARPVSRHWYILAPGAWLLALSAWYVALHITGATLTIHGEGFVSAWSGSIVPTLLPLASYALGALGVARTRTPVHRWLELQRGWVRGLAVWAARLLCLTSLALYILLLLFRALYQIAPDMVLTTSAEGFTIEVTQYAPSDIDHFEARHTLKVSSSRRTVYSTPIILHRTCLELRAVTEGKRLSILCDGDPAAVLVTVDLATGQLATGRRGQRSIDLRQPALRAP